MLKTSIAQWALRRSASAERAEAALGDLLEQAPSRGAFWFWKSVFQVTLVPLLPMYVDTVVETVLFYELLGSWRGLLCLLIANAVWVYLMYNVFHWPAWKGKGFPRFVLACVVIGILHHFHLEFPTLR
jgi:hypothetical protein